VRGSDKNESESSISRIIIVFYSSFSLSHSLEKKKQKYISNEQARNGNEIIKEKKKKKVAVARERARVAGIIT
jgi:hypothetical protein